MKRAILKRACPDEAFCARKYTSVSTRDDYGRTQLVLNMEPGKTRCASQESRWIKAFYARMKTQHHQHHLDGMCVVLVCREGACAYARKTLHLDRL